MWAIPHPWHSMLPKFQDSKENQASSRLGDYMDGQVKDTFPQSQHCSFSDECCVRHRLSAAMSGRFVESFLDLGRIGQERHSG